MQVNAAPGPDAELMTQAVMAESRWWRWLFGIFVALYRNGSNAIMVRFPVRGATVAADGEVISSETFWRRTANDGSTEAMAAYATFVDDCWVRFVSEGIVPTMAADLSDPHHHNIAVRFQRMRITRAALLRRYHWRKPEASST